MVGVKAVNYYTSSPATRPCAHYLIHESGGGCPAHGGDGFAWKRRSARCARRHLDYRTMVARGVVVRFKDTDLRQPQRARHPRDWAAASRPLHRCGDRLGVGAFQHHDAASLLHRRTRHVIGALPIPRHGGTSVRRASEVPFSVVVKVTTTDGRPVENVNVTLSRKTEVECQTADEVGRTNERGLFDSCLYFRMNDTFDATISRDGERVHTETFKVGRVMTEVSLKLADPR